MPRHASHHAMPQFTAHLGLSSSLRTFQADPSVDFPHWTGLCVSAHAHARPPGCSVALPPMHVRVALAATRLLGCPPVDARKGGAGGHPAARLPSLRCT
eukprot:365051-Chlamydomonas_euryale.AAC.9